MKDIFQIMYLIVDKKGIATISTLSYQRKDCIKKFLEGSKLTWKEVLKFGWKCIKVDVNITSSSNLERN